MKALNYTFLKTAVPQGGGRGHHKSLINLLLSKQQIFLKPKQYRSQYLSNHFYYNNCIIRTVLVFRRKKTKHI